MNLFFRIYEKYGDREDFEKIEISMMKYLMGHPKALKKVLDPEKFNILTNIGIKYEDYEVCKLINDEKLNRKKNE